MTAKVETSLVGSVSYVNDFANTFKTPERVYNISDSISFKFSNNVKVTTMSFTCVPLTSSKYFEILVITKSYSL